MKEKEGGRGGGEEVEREGSLGEGGPGVVPPATTARCWCHCCCSPGAWNAEVEDCRRRRRARRR